MAKYNKKRYNETLKKAEDLLGLAKLLDRFHSKDENEKLDAVTAEQLPQALVQTINNHVPAKAKYTKEMIEQYAAEDPTLKNFVQAAEGDLEDLIYSPESEFQKNTVAVFPDKITADYKEMSDKKESESDEFYAQFKIMSKALEYAGISADKINAPETIKKALKADSDPKNSEAIKKEIIDLAVNEEIEKTYKNKDGEYTVSKESINSIELFLKKSYERRFNMMKAGLIGSYLQKNKKDLGTYLANAGKTMTNVSGADPIKAGKQALENTLAYNTIDAVYSQYMQKGMPIYRIEKISYEDMGLKEKTKKESTTQTAYGMKQTMAGGAKQAATA